MIRKQHGNAIIALLRMPHRKDPLIYARDMKKAFGVRLHTEAIELVHYICII